MQISASRGAAVPSRHRPTEKVRRAGRGERAGAAGGDAAAGPGKIALQDARFRLRGILHRGADRGVPGPCYDDNATRLHLTMKWVVLFRF